MADFKKVWFITGASRGFGEKIAKAALDNGDAVVATARNPKDLSEKFHSPFLFPVKLDVTDEAEVKEAIQAAINKFGQIDVLVNNAGFGLLGAVEEATDDEVKKLYNTNVFGLLHVIRAALPFMRREKSGHIINFSSVGGYQSGPGFGVYCSTKFAVEGISEALFEELKPLNIHVTVVEPGYFRTDFLESSSLTTSKNIINDYASTSGKVRDKAKVISHNQPGDPDKLAGAIIELANSKNPPLRLPLGTDALEAIEKKNKYVEEEMEKWRELASSTNFS